MAIDTSCKTTSCGIVIDDKTVSEFSVCDNMTHSVKLMPLIDKSLKQSNISIEDVDMIAVTNGPGSYTGLRIGVVTGKTFAYVNNIPVIGVNTLDALSQGYCMHHGALTIPIIDARNLRVYAAGFFENELIIDYSALAISDLCNCILNSSIDKNTTEIIFTGDGASDANKVVINELLQGFNVTFTNVLAPSAKQIADVAHKIFENSCRDKNVFDAASLSVNYMKKYNSEI